MHRAAIAALRQSSYSGDSVIASPPTPETFTRIGPNRVATSITRRSSISRPTGWNLSPIVEVSRKITSATRSRQIASASTVSMTARPPFLHNNWREAHVARPRREQALADVVINLRIHIIYIGRDLDQLIARETALLAPDQQPQRH